MHLLASYITKSSVRLFLQPLVFLLELPYVLVLLVVVGQQPLHHRLHLFLLDLELPYYLQVHQLELLLHLALQPSLKLRKCILFWEGLQCFDTFGRAT